MITAIVNFSAQQPLDAEAAVERFTNSAPAYQSADGLHKKHFLRSPDGGTVGGIYFWESREAAEAFYTDEWRAGIESRFGSAPTVTYFEIPVTVEPDAVMNTRGVTVSRFIAARPETVFAAITDITRMGEFSPETASTEWVDGHDSPRVGARYVGHNRYGAKQWSIETEIVEMVDNERFSFDCYSPSTGKVFAHWGYIIEPAEGGCTVTEWTEDVRSEESKAASAARLGIPDRLTHNRLGMAETLQRLATACEAS
jgi:heme-degrading monooxygenase HmoA